MIRIPTPVYDRLLDAVSKVPVIDTHEHMGEPGRARREEAETIMSDPFAFLSRVYIDKDLWSGGASEADLAAIADRSATLDHRWEAFERAWSATRHTAYARFIRLAVRKLGIDRLTRETVEELGRRLASHSLEALPQGLRDAGVRAVITDVLVPRRVEGADLNPELTSFFTGKYSFPPDWHPVVRPLDMSISAETVGYVGRLVNADITSLHEFEAAVHELLRRCKEMGVIALKDVSGYIRGNSFDLPTFADAERVFNRILQDPRDILGWPEAKPLDDYLCHSYLRMARDLDLPQQIHTGHLNLPRNRVNKSNAANLAPLFELHTRVGFDLFHGNWPYMGDLLFLAKNYPNVRLNLCWTYIIDPIYAIELLKRAVVTVPHVKIHGFGGDVRAVPEFVTASLELARECIAAALADLVEGGWLDEQDAVQVAADWLFNNPNRFYRLGLPPYAV